ncbi:hypothetical protein ACHAXT_003630 [Thalassiosira profunda]
MKLFAVVSLLAASFASAQDSCCLVPSTPGQDVVCPEGYASTGEADGTVNGQEYSACCMGDATAGADDLDFDLCADAQVTTTAGEPETDAEPTDSCCLVESTLGQDVVCPEGYASDGEADGTVKARRYASTGEADGTVEGQEYSACCMGDAGTGADDLDFDLCSGGAPPAEGEPDPADGGASLHVAFGAAFAAVALHAVAIKYTLLSRSKTRTLATNGADDLDFCSEQDATTATTTEEAPPTEGEVEPNVVNAGENVANVVNAGGEAVANVVSNGGENVANVSPIGETDVEDQAEEQAESIEDQAEAAEEQIEETVPGVQAEPEAVDDTEDAAEDAADDAEDKADDVEGNAEDKADDVEGKADDVEDQVQGQVLEDDQGDDQGDDSGAYSHRVAFGAAFAAAALHAVM